MTERKTERQLREEVRTGLREYVTLRRRLGEPGLSFPRALRLHRRQCIANALADEDQTWLERIGLLDRLAEEEKVDLSAEESLVAVAAELEARDKRRDDQDQLWGATPRAQKQPREEPEGVGP